MRGEVVENDETVIDAIVLIDVIVSIVSIDFIVSIVSIAPIFFLALSY